MTNNNITKEEFVDNIKKWVQFDSMIQQHSQEIKTLREKRETVHDVISQYIETNSMQETVINISDGHLKYVEQNVTQPLTLTLLKMCLDEYFKDPRKADECLQHIKQNRINKNQKLIKRFYS
jgi:hypothetical protein